MTWRIRALFVCVLAGSLISALQAKNIDAGWKADLQTFHRQAADALDVPGSVVVVLSEGEGPTILTHGVRCLGGEDPIAADTSFGIGSLTKAFTATAAATLVEEGAIDWDTRARTVIPDFETRDPLFTDNVTLRDLLSHRSGLGDHNLIQTNIDGASKWILPRLLLVEPAGEFRDRFLYSSLGYTLAGELLGRVSGSSWNDVVTQHLLEPLGMDSTTVGVPAGTDNTIACGHHFFRGALTSIEPLKLGVGAAGNGLYSTSEDLVRWLELLLNDGKIDGRRVVGSQALRETWTPQVVVRSSGAELRAYGLGWNVSNWHGRKHLSHGGGGVGFTSQIRLFPDAGVAVVVLANRAASGLPDAVAERACNLLFGEELREDLLDTIVRMTERIKVLHAAPGEALRATADADAPPSMDVSFYAGCYENAVFGRLEVRVIGEHLVAAFHDIDLAVEHLHHDVFMLSSVYMGDLQATFTVASDAVSSVSVPLESTETEQVFNRVAGSCGEGFELTGP